jgi:hypothetical protein
MRTRDNSTKHHKRIYTSNMKISSHYQLTNDHVRASHE